MIAQASASAARTSGESRMNWVRVSIRSLVVDMEWPSSPVEVRRDPSHTPVKKLLSGV
jgi:hypothetical protein